MDLFYGTLRAYTYMIHEYTYTYTPTWFWSVVIIPGTVNVCSL